MNRDEKLLFALLAFQNRLIQDCQSVKAISLADDSFVKRFSESGQIEENDLRILLELHASYLRCFAGNAGLALKRLTGLEALRSDLAKPRTDSPLLDAISEAIEIVADVIPPELENTLIASAEANTASTGTSDRLNTNGRFSVIHEHARGGLGVVYLATDGDLKREVALKQIRADRSDQESYRAKFIQEAEITGQLEHPGIVPVYASGIDESGRLYYAMRFIRGQDLKSRIKTFHLEMGTNGLDQAAATLRELLRRLIDVIDAISYAHDRGVIHRDLKPNNVMLGKHGETLVVDWGLAKPLCEHSDQPTSASPATTEMPISPSGSKSASETAYGSFVGTMAYAPPEQIRGELDRMGPRSDIYSLGAILYEILTGRLPLTDGNTKAEILDRIEAGTVASPRMANPTTPAALDAICRKAMAPRMCDRYASAAELKRDIERWIDDEKVEAYREPVSVRARRWMRKHPAITSSAVVALILGFLASISVSTIVANHSSDLEIKNTQITNQSKELEETNAKILSQADAFRLTTARNYLESGINAFGTGAEEHGIRTLLQAFALSESDDALHETVTRHLWSRLTHDGTKLLPTIQHEHEIVALAMANENPWVATADTAGCLRIWNTNSGEIEHEITLKRELRPDRPGLRTLMFSTNDRMLGFIVDNGDIVIRDIPFMEEEQRTIPCGAWAFAFPGDSGKLFYVTDTTLYSYDFDSGKSTSVEGAVPPVRSVSIDPKKNMLAIAGDREYPVFLYNVNTQQSAVHRLSDAAALYADCIAVCPTGSRIAIGGNNDTATIWNTVDSEAHDTFLHDNVGVIAVEYSPDGLTLMTADERDVYLRYAESRHEIQPRLKFETRLKTASFSNDGFEIAVKTASGSVHLRRRPVFGVHTLGTKRTYEDHDRIVDIAVSADGSKIAYVFTQSNVLHVRSLRTFEMIVEKPLSSPCGAVKFMPAGDAVAVRTQDGIEVVPLDGSDIAIKLESRNCHWRALPLLEPSLDRAISTPDGWVVREFSDDGSLSCRTDESNQWSVEFFDRAGALCIAIPPRSPNTVQNVRFSGDNRYAAIAYSDDVVSIYDLLERRFSAAEIRTPVFCDSSTDSLLEFSPDGEFLATASLLKEKVSFWDPRTGFQAHRSISIPGWVTGLRFLPNGDLLTVSHRYQLSTWALKSPPLPESKVDRKTVLELFASYTVSKDGALTTLDEAGRARRRAIYNSDPHWNKEFASYAIDGRRIWHHSQLARELQGSRVQPLACGFHSSRLDALDKDASKQITPVCQNFGAWSELSRCLSQALKLVESERKFSEAASLVEAAISGLVQNPRSDDQRDTELLAKSQQFLVGLYLMHDPDSPRISKLLFAKEMFAPGTEKWDRMFAAWLVSCTRERVQDARTEIGASWSSEDGEKHRRLKHWMAIAAGEYKETVADLRSVAVEGPNNFVNLMFLADALRGSAQTEDAISAIIGSRVNFEQLDKSSVADVETKWCMERLEQHLTDLSKILEPRAPDEYVRTADEYFRSGLVEYGNRFLAQLELTHGHEAVWNRAIQLRRVALKVRSEDPQEVQAAIGTLLDGALIDTADNEWSLLLICLLTRCSDDDLDVLRERLLTSEHPHSTRVTEWIQDSQTSTPPSTSINESEATRGETSLIDLFFDFLTTHGRGAVQVSDHQEVMRKIEERFPVVPSYLSWHYDDLRCAIIRIGVISPEYELLYTDTNREIWIGRADSVSPLKIGSATNYGDAVCWTHPQAGLVTLKNNQLLHFGFGQNISRKVIRTFQDGALNDHLAVSMDMKSIAWRNYRGDITWDRNNNGIAFGVHWDPALNSSGSVFAFSAIKAPYVFRVRRNEEERDFEIPFHPTFSMAPSLNSDGTKIAFRMNGKNGSSQIGVLDLASSETKMLTNVARNHYFPVYSPDGKRLAFLRTVEEDFNKGQHLKLVVMDLTTMSETTIAEEVAFARAVWRITSRD